MLSDPTKHQLQFYLSTAFQADRTLFSQEYILYFGFSFGFSCQADNYKLPAQQQAANGSQNSIMTVLKNDIFKIMKAYISVSFSKRQLMHKEITAIMDTLKELNISSFVFVDKYKFDLTQERQMMKQAMIDIDNCDILIAETSDKGIGIGIEAGYAKAKGKTVIYLRQKDTEHSTTVSGISDFQIVYLDTNDLQNQLTDIVNKMEKIISPTYTNSVSEKYCHQQG
jgi:hypothetical protein